MPALCGQTFEDIRNADYLSVLIYFSINRSIAGSSQIAKATINNNTNKPV